VKPTKTANLDPTPLKQGLSLSNRDGEPLANRLHDLVAQLIDGLILKRQIIRLKQ
jgi:hypothetical protein